jgi:hypothetical protein
VPLGMDWFSNPRPSFGMKRSPVGYGCDASSTRFIR